MDWVRANGYGGVFAWSIDLDDFNDVCRQGEFPLLSAMYDKLRGYRVPLGEPHKFVAYSFPAGKLIAAGLGDDWVRLLAPPFRAGQSHLTGGSNATDQV